MDEILDLTQGREALRRLVDLLPPRGRVVRQGHPRHHPRAPVQQARDVRLHDARGCRGRAPAPRRDAGGDAAGPRPQLPRDRRRRGRPRLERRAQVRRRGLGADAGRVPRAHLDDRTARPTRRAGSTSATASPPTARGGKTQHVATLNGTLATTRWIVAILETHQRADGSVTRARGAAALPRRPRGAWSRSRDRSAPARDRAASRSSSRRRPRSSSSRSRATPRIRRSRPSSCSSCSTSTAPSSSRTSR